MRSNKFTIFDCEEAAMEQAEKDFMAGNQDLTTAEREHVLDTDLRNFVAWDQKLGARNPHIIGYNKAMSENAKQFGHRPGVNTGNGQFECRMSMHLFLALGATKYPDDPDWWQDDNKFYAFLKEHPELDARPGKHRSQGAIDPTWQQLIS